MQWILPWWMAPLRSYGAAWRRVITALASTVTAYISCHMNVGWQPGRGRVHGRAAGWRPVYLGIAPDCLSSSCTSAGRAEKSTPPFGVAGDAAVVVAGAGEGAACPDVGPLPWNFFARSVRYASALTASASVNS